MRVLTSYVAAILMLSGPVMLFAAQGEIPKAEAQVQKDTSEKPPPEAVPTEERDGRNRAGENLLGQADTSKGEARRNENVQINLLDTNAVRELNVRVGTTATIVEEFVAERGYWATEYGTALATLSALNGSKVPAFTGVCSGITTTVPLARDPSFRSARSSRPATTSTAQPWGCNSGTAGTSPSAGLKTRTVAM